MSYKLTFEIKNNYLYAAASGKRSPRNNINLASSCLDACKKNNLNRVLLDLTGVTGKTNTFADYELAKLLESWGLGKIIIQAALVQNADILPAGRFFETTSRNRNINVSVFTDKKNAEEWIIKD
jgi:alpha-D-ribose 1-methylphosphonate 5-phosphate C-P lyase